MDDGMKEAIEKVYDSNAGRIIRNDISSPSVTEVADFVQSVSFTLFLNIY